MTLPSHGFVTCDTCGLRYRRFQTIRVKGASDTKFRCRRCVDIVKKAEREAAGIMKKIRGLVKKLRESAA